MTRRGHVHAGVGVPRRGREVQVGGWCSEGRGATAVQGGARGRGVGVQEWEEGWGPRARGRGGRTCTRASGANGSLGAADWERAPRLAVQLCAAFRARPPSPGLRARADGRGAGRPGPAELAASPGAGEVRARLELVPRGGVRAASRSAPQIDYLVAFLFVCLKTKNTHCIQITKVALLPHPLSSVGKEKETEKKKKNYILYWFFLLLTFINYSYLVNKY